jgi:ribosomal protein L29
MKMKELKDKSSQELQKLLEEKQVKLFQIRFDTSVKQTKNYKELLVIKKDISRIKMLLSHK